MTILQGNYTVAYCFASALFSHFLFNHDRPFLGENITVAVLLNRHSRICRQLKVGGVMLSYVKTIV